jgi:hypothetical protein
MHEGCAHCHTTAYGEAVSEDTFLIILGGMYALALLLLCVEAGVLGIEDGSEGGA